EGPSRARVWIAAVALVLLAAAVAAVWLLREPSGPAIPPGESRPSLAVLGFRNLSRSPASDWIGPALAEMLTTELAAGGQVRMVSGENVARARASADVRSLDPESLRRLHSILGCELLVVGSYVPLGDGEDARIRLDLRMLRLPSGESAATLAEVGNEPEMFELVARTGARLRLELGLAELSREQARAARALQPASNEAARLYAEGLARLHAFDTPRAVELLGRAAEADPQSAVIRSALAQAWSALGYDARAAEQAAKAVELSAPLPRPERLAIQARSYQVARQWSKASEVYRTLWTFAPDDLEHGLSLARSLAESGRASDALSVIGDLRKLRPPAGEDPRIDLAEAYTALRQSDPARVLPASRRAEQKGRISGEPLIVAQALYHQGAALLLQGDSPAAIRLFEQARTLFEEAGDTLGVATALTYIGVALQKQGDLARAESVYNEALTLVERLGNVSGLAAQLGNLGILYQSQGDLKRALDHLERAHARFAEIDDPLLESRVLGASASILFHQADLARARSRVEEAL
ncbi:MAG TPA: tetratricopeptide repeat protein, partial [Solirubrobacterales bacterium]